MSSETLEAYLEVTARLKSEIDAGNEARILPVLDSQIEELNESGIVVPEPDQEVLPQLDTPSPTLSPTPSPTPLVTPFVTEIPEITSTLPAPEATSLPIAETLPPVDPTDLPETDPTIDIPSLVP